MSETDVTSPLSKVLGRLRDYERAGRAHPHDTALPHEKASWTDVAADTQLTEREKFLRDQELSVLRERKFAGKEATPINLTANNDLLTHALDLLAQFDVQVATIDTSAHKLVQEYEALQQEAERLGKDRRAVEASSFDRVLEYFLTLRQLNTALHGLEQQQKQFERDILAKPDKMSPSTVAVQQIQREAIARIRHIMETQLPFTDPEAFIAHNLTKLRLFKEEFNKTGMIHTESRHQLKADIKAKLAQKGLVVLVGETGTGKTFEAIAIAEEESQKHHKEGWNRDKFFIAGHKYLKREDLLGYLGLTSDKVPPEEVPHKVEEALEKYTALNPGFTEESEDYNEVRDMITRAVMGQAENPQLKTEEMVGKIRKAQQEGRVVVFDEWNFVDPGLLPSIYQAMQEKGKPGYALILTGNISLSGANRYIERQQIDSAMLRRLNSGMIEYNTPPMDDIDTSLELSILPDVDRKAGKKPSNRELFQIALTHLVDDKGNLYAPEVVGKYIETNGTEISQDALERVWRLVQAFKLFQNNFAGLPMRNPADKFNGEQEIRLNKYHASLSTLNDILRDWKGHQFEYPLDYYLYEHLIRPASLLAPREAGYMFNILQVRYGFFNDSRWYDRADSSNGHSVVQLDMDTATLRAQNLDDKNRKWLTESVKGQNLKVYEATEIAEAFSGYKTPDKVTPLVRTENGPPPIDREKVMREVAEMQAELDPLEEWFKNFEQTLEYFCSDESNIKRAPTP